MPSAPIIFGAILAGAVVIDYGVRNAKGAISSAQATTASTTTATGASTGGSGTGSLAPGASRMSANQRTFASELQAKTGLDPGVIAAWMAAEEPIGASSGYGGTQDWLNVGITDSGSFGAADSVWSDPKAAADATAAWMEGQASAVAGYGTASSGVQSILASVGKGAAAEIAAIQQSGWASSGYPDLPSLYTQMSS